MHSLNDFGDYISNLTRNFGNSLSISYGVDNELTSYVINSTPQICYQEWDDSDKTEFQLRYVQILNVKICKYNPSTDLYQPCNDINIQKIISHIKTMTKQLYYIELSYIDIKTSYSKNNLLNIISTPTSRPINDESCLPSDETLISILQTFKNLIIVAGINMDYVKFNYFISCGDNCWYLQKTYESDNLDLNGRDSIFQRATEAVLTDFKILGSSLSSPFRNTEQAVEIETVLLSVVMLKDLVNLIVSYEY